MEALEEFVRKYCAKQIDKSHGELSAAINRVQVEVSEMMLVSNAQAELRQKTAEEQQSVLWEDLHNRITAVEGSARATEQASEQHHLGITDRIQDLKDTISRSASEEQFQQLALRTHEGLSSMEARVADAHAVASDKVSILEFSTMVNGMQDNIRKIQEVMSDSLSKQAAASTVDGLQEQVNKIEETVQEHVCKQHLQQQIQTATQVVHTQVSDINDQVVGIQETLSKKALASEDALKKVEHDIHHLKEAVSLKASMQQFDDAVAELQDQVLELDELVRQSNGVQELHGSIAGIQQQFKATWSEIGEKVMCIEELVEGIQEALEHKVCEKDLTAVSQKVSMVEMSLGGFVSEQAFGDVMARVHSDVAGLQHSVSEKASTQEVQADLAGLERQEEQQRDAFENAIELRHVRKELEEMREQWKHLGGHMNPNQRIQHFKDVKQENLNLRNELLQVSKQLFRQTGGSPNRLSPRNA